jgi:hypothetical protein
MTLVASRNECVSSNEENIMKHGLMHAIGFAAAALLSAGVSAQTTANGPYYAAPSWDQKLQCDTLATCPRFVVLSNWNSEAVLDRETGLVWEKSPSTDSPVIGSNSPVSWYFATGICANKKVGGRTGWRLPSFQELMSLVDPSVPAPGPTLPAGSPFANVQQNGYWSATAVADSTPPLARYVHFEFGLEVEHDKTDPANLVWCTRGGGPLDNY